MYAVLIRFKVGDEMRRRALQAMRDVAPLMTGVTGLKSIDVLESADDPVRPAFYEVWEDRAAYETFNADRPPQIAAETATIASCFAGRPEILAFEVAARY